MRLEISQFGGMAPLVDPTALADRLSTFARNVRFDRGALSPEGFSLGAASGYPDITLQNTSIRSVAKLFANETRFAFVSSEGSNAFPSPVTPTDTHGRVYFMSGLGPRFATGHDYVSGGLNVNPSSFRLGVPPPGSAPVINEVWVPPYPIGGTTGDPDAEDDPDWVSVAYVYTFVDVYGHESAPSPASPAVRIAYNRDTNVNITMGSPLPAGVDFSDGGGALRLYRATFDGSSMDWQFIMSSLPTSPNVIDITLVGQEAESLISETWLPPNTGMRGMCLVGSSFAAGFFDFYICYSETRLPHAWPTELQYPIKYTPLALQPMANGLLIVTDGRPYWAEGFDPYSAIPREVPVNASCLSGDSLVDMGGAAYYMGDSGIVRFSGGRAEVVSETFLDRAAVMALVDGTCKAFATDGRYVFSTRDNRWMAFDAEHGLVEMAFGVAPSEVASISYSVRDDLHYFALQDGRVRKVDYSTEATAVAWHSRYWRTAPASFSCVRVEADTYPVQVRVRSQYLGGAWEATPWITLAGPHIARLPSMVGTLWQVQIQPPTGGRVYRAILAQSGKETA